MLSEEWSNSLSFEWSGCPNLSYCDTRIGIYKEIKINVGHFSLSYKYHNKYNAWKNTAAEVQLKKREITHYLVHKTQNINMTQKNIRLAENIISRD